MIEKGSFVEIFFKLGSLKIKGTILSMSDDHIHLLYEDGETQSFIYNPKENVLLIKIPVTIEEEAPPEVYEQVEQVDIRQKVRERTEALVQERLVNQKQELKSVSKFLNSPPQNLDLEEYNKRYEFPNFKK